MSRGFKRRNSDVVSMFQEEGSNIVYDPQHCMTFPHDFLPKLIGLFSLFMSFSMFGRRDMLLEIYQEAANSRSISYVMGMMMLLVGLTLVIGYNQWNSASAKIITVFSWIVLLESWIFLFASGVTIKRYMDTMNSTMIYYGIAGLHLMIGVYLIYIGFSRR